MSKYIEEGPPHVILDLTGIDFVDSSGVGALVQLAKQVQGQSGSLQTVSNARVTQTVKLVRLEKFLSLRQSVEEALNHVPPATGSASEAGFSEST